MSVFTNNLIIYTGTDFQQTFVLEDDQSNSLMNLYGYSACAQMKRYESSSTSTSFNVSFVGDRTNGKVTVSLGSSATAGLKPGRYFYDILLNSPQGLTSRVIEGEVFVKKSVTR